MNSAIFRMMPFAMASIYAAISVLSVGDVQGFLVLAAGHAAIIFAACVMTGSALLAVVMLRRGAGEAIVAVRRSAAIGWARDHRHAVLLPLACFVLTMAAYTLCKQRLLSGIAFAAGPQLAALDHAILGRDAWQVTHRLLPWAWASQALDLLYHAWFLPMTLGIALCAAAGPDSLLAWRYRMSFVLQWIIQGTALAMALPAAGPCFFARFQVESGRFAALHERLTAQDKLLEGYGTPGLKALHIQDHLLRLYESGNLMVGGGISAMPSLHNAMAILFACAAFQVRRWLGVLFAGYALVIWVGSIHLGWHYAVDGVVAAVVTLTIWSATGWLAARGWQPRRASGRVPAPAC